MSIKKFRSIYENVEDKSVREYLQSLDNKLINDLISKWDQTKDHDILNDILLEVDDIVDEEQFQFVSKKISEL